jgi:YHS domain-containing protein
MKSLLLTLLLLFIAFPAFAADEVTPDDHWLRPVENGYVCMVNDTHFESYQIPVAVEDKTYYGCCAGCVSTLQNNPDVRYAVDPVSGVKVDKATAIVGGASDKKVYYFESLENLNAYQKPE